MLIRMQPPGTLTTTAAIVLGTQTTSNTRTKNHHPRIAASRRYLGGTRLRGWQLVRKRSPSVRRRLLYRWRKAVRSCSVLRRGPQQGAGIKSPRPSRRWWRPPPLSSRGRGCGTLAAPPRRRLPCVQRPPLVPARHSGRWPLPSRLAKHLAVAAAPTIAPEELRRAFLRRRAHPHENWLQVS